ncbi:MAG: DUF6492 family protein [Cyanobacteria bacterium P01_A01_bin.84]
MQKNDFAIITLSYAPDFERCRLLCWSIEKYVSANIKHYVIVDSRDLSLFQQLQRKRTEIIAVESILPWWIRRIPVVQNGWFSLKNVVLRNWIIQQIAKLAIAQYIDSDVLIFVDSDTFFVRIFDEKRLFIGNKLRLFREPPFNEATHLRGHAEANKLLNINTDIKLAPGYIGNVITWKRDNVFKLYQAIESISGKGWIETVVNSPYLSEYILYGVFVDKYLKADSGHYYEEQKNCHEYWTPKPLSDQELKDFFGTIEYHHVAVMISAKAGIPVNRYEYLLKGTEDNLDGGISDPYHYLKRL